MSPFIWLAVAAVMAVVEVVSFGLITMWFVIGALAAFAANLLGADLLVQIVVFLVVSVVCLVALRPVFVKYRDRGKQELSLIHIFEDIVAHGAAYGEEAGERAHASAPSGCSPLTHAFDKQNRLSYVRKLDKSVH